MMGKEKISTQINMENGIEQKKRRDMGKAVFDKLTNCKSAIILLEE